MLENLHDIMKATDAFFKISAEIMICGKVLVFMANWKLSTDLLRRIQTDFDKSKKHFFMFHFMFTFFFRTQLRNMDCSTILQSPTKKVKL